jgi:hypothetical protein
MSRAAGRAEAKAVLSFIRPTLRALDDHPVDLIILPVFSDEQPFEGLADVVDWRLTGALSRWRREGFSRGDVGERVLFPCRHRLEADALIVFGLGARAAWVPENAVALAQEAAQVATGLGATRITTTLFGLERLAVPLERTAARLVLALTSAAGLSMVRLAVRDEAERATRDALAHAERLP